MKLGGCYTAIVTPFNEQATEIDFESIESLIDFQPVSYTHLTLPTSDLV